MQNTKDQNNLKVCLKKRTYLLQDPTTDIENQLIEDHTKNWHQRSFEIDSEEKSPKRVKNDSYTLNHARQRFVTENIEQ